MKRLAVTAFAVASATMIGAPARAQKKQPAADAPISLPSVGGTLAPNGAPDWPQKLDWLYDVPSFKDATGKIVLHWFCAPKIDACTEDLARVTTLKEQNGRVYVIAYINGTKVDAKKLDPIRAEEGVGRGTVAFGRNVGSMMKRMGIPGPASIVVGLDSKVAFATTGSGPADLDARDAKVISLARAIKDYTTSSDGPKLVKPGAKFQLAMKIKLSPWLKFSKRTPAEFKLTVSSDIKCDATTLRGDQLRLVDPTTMIAQVSCSGPKGVYEARGAITFGYDNPIAGAAGLGTEGTGWMFEIKP